MFTPSTKVAADDLKRPIGPDAIDSEVRLSGHRVFQIVAERASHRRLGELGGPLAVSAAARTRHVPDG